MNINADKDEPISDIVDKIKTSGVVKIENYLSDVSLINKNVSAYFPTKILLMNLVVLEILVL